ncbi:MAG: hypothetical protein Kow0027_28180 [Saprospiraceae bacterium]
MKLHYYLLCISLFIFSTLKAQFDWEPTNGPEGGSVRLVANADYVFTAGTFKFFRSADGLNWESFDAPPIFLFGAGQDMLAGVIGQAPDIFSYYEPTQFAVSFDNGVSWEERPFPQPLKWIDWDGIRVLSHGIYVFVRNIGTCKIYRSTDTGYTWEELNLPTFWFDQMDSFDDNLFLIDGGGAWKLDAAGNWQYILFPGGFYNFDCEVFKGSKCAVASGNIVYTSDDDGLNWNTYTINTAANTHLNLVVMGEDLYVHFGNDDIARIEGFNGSLTYLLDSETELAFSLGPIAFKGNIIGDTYYEGVKIWNESLPDWTLANSGLNLAEVKRCFRFGSKILAATGNDIYEYDPNSETWNDTPIFSKIENGVYWNVADDDSSTIIVSMMPLSGNIAFDTFYVSTDGGETFESRFVETVDLGGTTYAAYLSRIYFYDGVLFAHEPDLFLHDGYWRSEDLGLTWEYIDTRATSIAGFGGDLYALGEFDHLLKSEDLGKTWTQINSGPLPTLDLLMPVGEKLFGYRFSSKKLYTTEDGENWQNASTGLPEIDFLYDFWKVDINYDAGIYYLWKYGTGVFASTDGAHSWFKVIGPNVWNPLFVMDGIGYVSANATGLLKTAISSQILESTIQGTVFLDENDNNSFDPGEIPLESVEILLNRKNNAFSQKAAKTDPNGYYNLGYNFATQDTILPNLNSPFITGIEPLYYLSGDTTEFKNFAVKMQPGINDLGVTAGVLQDPRVGLPWESLADAANLGSVPADAVVTVELDTNLIFSSANPYPDSIAAGKLYWNLGTLNILVNKKIRVNNLVKPDVDIDTPVNLWWRIETTLAESDTTNNLWHIQRLAVNSYDPNAKYVQPAEGLTATEIENGKEIFYTIQFQNTGNAPAYRVKIRDQLDTALNWSTVRLVLASHEVSSFSVNSDGLLEVIFDDINLPDSLHNEPESHGFVTFAVQRNKFYDSEDEIVNQAAIYFDLNDPIYTNEVKFGLNEIVNGLKPEPRLTLAANLEIAPNPANDIIKVKASYKEQDEVQLRILDVSGRVIREISANYFGVPLSVDISGLRPGMYFIKWSGKFELAASFIVE